MTEKLSRKELLKLYRWTLGYFKPHWLTTTFYVVCGGTMIWGELMIPRRMGYLIDQVLPKNDLTLLGSQMLMICGLVALILMSKAIYNYLEVIISNRITKHQQTDLMLKLQTLGFSYYEKVPTGQILSLFENSVRETQKTYTFLFPQFIYSLAQFAVPSAVLLLNQPIFFLAAMVGNGFYVFLNQYANTQIERHLGTETKAAQASQQALYDTLSGVTELKAMGSQEWFLEKTMLAYDRFRVPKMKSIFWRHFRFTTVGLTLTVSTVLFYVYGLDLVRAGDLQLGEFIGYSFLMGLVSRGFSVFFYIIPAQLHALNYAKHLYDFMHLVPDVVEQKVLARKPMTQHDIVFDGVSFGYSKDQPLLHDLSLTIPAGQKTAIVGESGCGKSTMLKLIGRFYEVSAGSIRMGGTDLREISLSDLRDPLGFVFQESYLFNLSIRENIRFGCPEATDEAVETAAQLACAHDFILETEKGYDTLVGERGTRLSGGQRQRIAIARMLLKNPRILLLDEATSALDTMTESAVKQAFEHLSEGRTVIAVAHRLSTIIAYDNIIVLDGGRIAEQGDYATLMARQGLFYGLVMRGESVDYAS